MNVEKITVKKVSESVVEQIEKMIKQGAFQAGEKLPSVREMCDMFGVGRSAIRDAIITLKGKGTVDIRQGEGTYVCRFDSTRIFNNHLIIPETSDVRALFQVRKILEPGIAEMAAQNRTERQLLEIEEILSNKTSNGWEEDYNFHMTIAKASRNEIIFQLIQYISTTTKKHMTDFHQFIQKDPKLIAKINEQHYEIFQEIKENNAQLAKIKMTEHLEYVEDILQKSLWKPTSQKREEQF